MQKKGLRVDEGQASTQRVGLLRYSPSRQSASLLPRGQCGPRSGYTREPDEHGPQTSCFSSIASGPDTGDRRLKPE